MPIIITAGTAEASFLGFGSGREKNRERNCWPGEVPAGCLTKPLLDTFANPSNRVQFGNWDSFRRGAVERFIISQAPELVESKAHGGDVRLGALLK